MKGRSLERYNEREVLKGRPKGIPVKGAIEVEIVQRGVRRRTEAKLTAKVSLTERENPKGRPKETPIEG